MQRHCEGKHCKGHRAFARGCHLSYNDWAASHERKVMELTLNLEKRWKWEDYRPLRGALQEAVTYCRWGGKDATEFLREQ